MAYSGKFRPRNPKKYRGDPSKIVYRSSWEARCMTYFDTNENVLWWASEEVIVPYKHPIDGKYHRYYPDFIIKVRQRNGQIKTMMIEVKPEYQKNAPKKQTRKTKKYINEVVTYATNQAKWKAAEDYCADRKWEFRVMTENDLGIKS
tara:strand:- start:655 stop:1095 length:441 start_codon:yes stop_codon:yes gene_type:complete